MNDKDKEIDPSLSAPQEANTGKHINFLAEEDAGSNDNDDRSGDHDDANESPTKKAWEELRKENRNRESSKD